MNNEQIIKTIKFHSKESLKYLLELRLADENLTNETIKQIKQAFKMLELNLIKDLTNNTL